MRYPTRLIMLITLLTPAAGAAETAPGETSGPPLAPLVVTGYDAASGELRLSYQSGCGATDNTIYYGPLDQVSSLAWSGEACGIGTSGTHPGFHPGSGSYFFVIVGDDGAGEGSYGRARLSGAPVERAPHTGNTCGHPQSLAGACAPAAVGDTCSSSLDCGLRNTCVPIGTGAAECACLPPFRGTYCESCAPGYAGPDCRQCAPGFVSNEMQLGDSGDLPIDRTAPQVFRCEPDVPGDCTGIDCSGRGTCVVSGRDAICACEPGFTGSDCQDCAPNFERDAAGACTFGAACRDAKCGGHGQCVSASFGEVVCQCDAGYAGADCGGPPLQIATEGETLSLYDAESVILTPQGGAAPYDWALAEGPARIAACDPRVDPACPAGGARLTIVAPIGGIPELMLVKVNLTDGGGLQTAINLAAIPPTYMPFTGPIRTELVPFYQAMLKYMRARGIRGGVLGIAKGGSIVATNGYGYRNAGLDGDPFVNAGAGEGGPLVQPHSPFRIASVTKPLTAAAVRSAAADAGVNIASAFQPNRAATFVQQSLGFNLLNGNPPFNYNVAAPNNTDPRWATVSIAHLLNHHVGFWRDSALPALNGLPAYNTSRLPFTVNPSDPNNPNDFQPALSGFSSDITYATSHVLAGLQLAADPRPTVANTILFAAGNTFQYAPGQSTAGGDNYANIGYMLAGRVLEGLKGENYDPDDPTAPEGWGKFPTLLQDYLCESSGIQSGIYPGDAFNPQPGEPYYREVDEDGNERWSWNVAHGTDKVRWNNQAQIWEFCQANCPNGPGAVWDTSSNTPSAYGGVWLAQRNSAGGMVATTSALLKFARNHRVKVGAPGDGNIGIGSLLNPPASYGSGSSHNGSLPGTASWLWQLGGFRANNVPLPWFSWHSDPTAPLDLDENGNVEIEEATILASSCVLPSDVAVAVVFNQREDRRAPGIGGVGSSSNNVVYGRIFDFLGDAACKVDAEGWPQLAEPPAQIAMQPDCD